MARTKIDWAEKVWNPVTGCTKVSEGCRHCYAERMAKRLAGRNGYPPKPDQFKVTLHPEKLEEPLHWKKPARIFVDSMGDLFHPKVPDTFIDQVFWTMMKAPIHIFIILTKRPARMMEWVFRNLINSLPNVWLGISVEDQMTADERIPWLLRTPAAVRFISVEPMLEKIDVRLNVYSFSIGTHLRDTHSTIKTYVKWVISGCESGPGARPMELDWARSLRDQCQAASVPFFFKQAMIDGKLVKMPELDGKVWREYPEIVDNGQEIDEFPA